MELHDQLTEAKQKNKLPKLIVYNRIDGPGSSLDLRLFQQSMWTLSNIPQTVDTKDPALKWSHKLPRTVGITIDVGTEIQAEPLEQGKIGVESIDFGFSYIYDIDNVPPIKENWLLRIIETFGLDGVKLVIKNQHPELKSAGLGGSAAVTTGTALLCNALTGYRFSPPQLIAMASFIEQDLGVSITGTQEQSCAMYGGVRDYLWFPWGMPGKNNSYGTSVRQELLKEPDYEELRKRLDIYFVISRHSKDVNQKWLEEMKNVNGFTLHKKKPGLAYKFREGIRKKDWNKVGPPIEKYRKIRTKLCIDYMSKGAKNILKTVKQHNSYCFPLGGGGGSVMVYSPQPENISEIRKELSNKYKPLDYRILPYGHKMFNLE